MKYKFEEVFNIPELQRLCESFTQINDIVTALLDLEGKIYISTGWKQICTQFHRKHAICGKECTLSDTLLANQAKNKSRYNMYKCKNGLIDVAIPIYIKKEHVGNFFTGQFLLEPPDIDFFRNQAQRFGFDQKEYLSALKKVPIVSEDEIKKSAMFLADLTEHIGETGLKEIESRENIKKLKDERTKFRNLFNDAKDAIILLNPDGTFFDVNKSASKLFKLPGKNLIGKNVVDLSTKTQYKGEDSKERAEILINLCLHGKPQYFEWLHCDSEGNTIDTSVSLNKIELSGEIYLQAIIRDITKQKQTELKLIREKERAEESEQRYKLLHNAAFSGIFIHNNGIIIDCNLGLSDLTGFSQEELIGMDGLLLLTEKHRDFTLSKMDKGLKNSYDAVGLRKNGEEYPVRIEARNILYKNGTVRCVELRDITEQKFIEAEIIKAKERAEESEYFLEESQRTGKIGAYKLDFATGFWISTKFLDNIYGIDDTYEKTVNGWLEIVHPEDREFMANYFQNEVIGKRLEFNQEYRIIRYSDKKIRWLHGVGKLYFDKNNNLTSMLGTIQDITERKNYEIKLKAEQERFKALADNVPGSIYLCNNDANYSMLYLNDGIKQILGYDKEVFLTGKMHFTDIYHPDDINTIVTKVNKAVENNTSFDLLFRIKHKNGEWRWIHEYGTGIYKNDILDYLIGFLIDVTKEKQAEEELIKAKKNAEEREFFLRESQRVGNIGSFNMNLLSKEIVSTETVDEIFGADEKAKKTIQAWMDFIHPDDREKVQTYFQNEVIGKKHPFEQEYRIIRQDDKKIRWVYCLGKLYFDDANNITHIMGTVQDISERKIIEEERRAMNRTLENKVKERTEQLQQANKDLESFAYSVSHDLRAPIRHIIGFTGLLEKALVPMDEKTGNYIKKILLSSRNMSVMIDELLKFSRLGRVDIKYNSVNLTSIIHDIVVQSKPDYEGRNIVWKIGKLPKVYGDAALLKIAFENLISNAIKYSAKKEQAIIEIGKTDKTPQGRICVFVKDNGAGFDMNYKQKLFDVFQRLHKDDEFEGIGIGLANVKQIIKKHNGAIDVEARINKGAAFYISLPELQ